MNYLEGMIELILKKEPGITRTRLSLKSGGQSFLIGSIYKDKNAILKIPIFRGENPFSDYSNLISIEDEAAILSGLYGIPGIVEVYSSDYVTADKVNIPYLILKEYDRTLDQEVRALTAERLLNYTGMLFQGIMNIHERGIVHRDIKSTNCLIEDLTSSLVIADFGIAKQYDPFNLEADKIYTEDMASPEQKQGICVPQIDVWGAATVYLSLLMGMTIKQVKDRNYFLTDLRHEFVHSWEGPTTNEYYTVVSSRFGELAEASVDLFRRAFAFNWRERADIYEIIDLFEKIKNPNDLTKSL